MTAKLTTLAPNLQLIMGDDARDRMVVSLYMKPTLYNRARYWLFSKFFPFKVKWI